MIQTVTLQTGDFEPRPLFSLTYNMCNEYNLKSVIGNEVKSQCLPILFLSSSGPRVLDRVDFEQGEHLPGAQDHREEHHDGPERGHHSHGDKGVPPLQATHQ